jgi:hypothetical protein
MRKDYSKIIYALIGIIGATLGMKLIGTPWYIDLAIYFTEFSTLFLILTTWKFWKELNLAMRIVRVFAILLFATSSITQTFIYSPIDQNPPVWFPFVINILQTMLALAFIWSAWMFKPHKANKSCLGL